MPKLLPGRQIQGVNPVEGLRACFPPRSSSQVLFSPYLAPDLDMKGIHIIPHTDLSIWKGWGMPTEAKKCLPVLKETHFDWDSIASSGLIGVPHMNIDGYT